MSLASELTSAGTPPGRLDVRCRITMDEVEGRGHLIVHSAIDVRAVVPGADEEGSPQASRPRTRAVRSRRLLDAGVGMTSTRDYEEEFDGDRSHCESDLAGLAHGRQRTDRGRRQRRVRPARRDVGLPGRVPRRPDEPRGADRGRLAILLLDGAVPRARRRGNAAGAARDLRRPSPSSRARGSRRARSSCVGGVPGLDHAGFLEHAETAVANCPVSKALAGIPEVTLDATLAT